MGKIAPKEMTGAAIRKIALVLAIFIGSVALDQGTKVLAQESLNGVPPQSFLGDLFRLEYSENPGAFLSLGAALSADMRFWILSVLVAGFLIGAIYYLFSQPKLSRLSTISLSLVIGGGASNLIDRVFRINGRVVDFMNLGIGSLRTGIFNVADVAIMGGVILLMLETLKEKNGPHGRKGRA